MDKIKKSFQKVKQDINQLNNHLQEMKKELELIQLSLLELVKNQQQTHQNQQQTPQNTLKNPKNTSTHNQTHNLQNQTIRHINQTHPETSTHSSTHIYPLQPLKPQYSHISTGNQGVSTDRQTDRQTDTNHQKTQKTSQTPQNTQQNQTFQTQQQTPQPEQKLEPNPTLILEQLDTIKKELRLKIKRLTNQEMLVLSSIYQFEDQDLIVDYKLLSQKLSLSESSIRDYIKRIISKGIPIIKEKINNKRIILHISANLKQLATLNTLISLREL